MEKCIKLIISIIFTISIYVMALAGDPNPPPPGCCGYEHSSRAATYTDPVTHEVKGVRSDVIIYHGIEVVTGQTIHVPYPYCGDDLATAGGDDNDVCINADNNKEYSLFGALRFLPGLERQRTMVFLILMMEVIL